MKKNNNTSKKVALTSAERVLAALFVFGFILGFILTPLGVETRSPEIRTLLFAVFFIIVGLLIPLAGLVLLWLRKTRFAGVLAVIGAAIMFLVPPADQALFFFTVSPPPAVTLGEFILIFVGIGYMLYGPKVYEIKKTQNANISLEPKE